MMNRPALDLSVYAFRRELGDITIYGTWLHPLEDDGEPCIALVPTFRRLIDVRGDNATVYAKPCVIALSAAYKYDDPRYLLVAARGAAETMGFEDSMSRTHKIAEAIHGSLLDLIKMPPRPIISSQAVADLTIRDSEGRTHHTEIIENG